MLEYDLAPHRVRSHSLTSTNLLFFSNLLCPVKMTFSYASYTRHVNYWLVLNAQCDHQGKYKDVATRVFKGFGWLRQHNLLKTTIFFLRQLHCDAAAIISSTLLKILNATICFCRALKFCFLLCLLQTITAIFYIWCN